MITVLHRHCPKHLSIRLINGINGSTAFGAPCKYNSICCGWRDVKKNWPGRTTLQSKVPVGASKAFINPSLFTTKTFPDSYAALTKPAPNMPVTSADQIVAPVFSSRAITALVLPVVAVVTNTKPCACNCADSVSEKGSFTRSARSCLSGNNYTYYKALPCIFKPPHDRADEIGGARLFRRFVRPRETDLVAESAQ